MTDAPIPVPATAPTPAQHPLYWKFSRDGGTSDTYISFIFDIPDSQIKSDGKIWVASFQQLSTVLLLLQDVEMLNNETLEDTSFVNAVHECVYRPPQTAAQLRDIEKLVSGTDIIGRHNGDPLPYGCLPADSSVKTIELDVTWFAPTLHIDGRTGKILKTKEGPRRASVDLLRYYRKIIGFDQSANYWDLMPKHLHIKGICNAMKSLDAAATEEFLTGTLKWQKRVNAVPAAVAAPSRH